jgi:D-arabinose 1-dehydrogenase-like Zn-dependent alcohol dehydrogenase
MRAIVVSGPGGPDKLELRTDVPAPLVRPGWARLKVRATGVCGRDLIDRKGGYPFTKWPVIPGHEVAGEVVEVGPQVDAVRVGQRVAVTHRAPCGRCAWCQAGRELYCRTSPFALGMTVDGGYAEEVLCDAAALVPIPDRVGDAEAAIVHCTAGVALRALRDHGGVALGQSVLITGASGGVGIHAVQIACILGLRTIAQTSNPAKADALRAAGAEHVIVTSDTRDLANRARAASPSGMGVDVALELVGAPTFQGSLRALRPGGRVTIVGNISTERVEVNPGYLIMNEVSVGGSASATRADLAMLLDLVARGVLKPVVAERLPLERAREAQERLAEKGVVGRLVLVP